MEPHVFRSVDELEDSGGGLIVMFIHWFDAEDAGVAARAVEVAVTEDGEETGEVLEGFLRFLASVYTETRGDAGR